MKIWPVNFDQLTANTKEDKEKRTVGRFYFLMSGKHNVD